MSDPAALERVLRGRLQSPGGAGLTVSNGRIERGGFLLDRGQSLPGHLLVVRGTAGLRGTVKGNVVVLDGDLDLESGALVQGDALVLGGRILDRGGSIRGERRVLARAALPAAEGPVGSGGVGSFGLKLAGVAGVFTTLVLLGFGLVFFARPQLEVVSDTVANHLFRSFLTGLLAQIVALPTAGLLLIGLALSVIGILVIPFVAIVVPLLLLAAVLMGFLGVAHAMGESRIRRRMAEGRSVGSPNSYRYVLLGLGGSGTVWLAWVGFGWVPFAGTLVLLLAIASTWALATAGLGAFLLSRGGLRSGFAGKFIPPEALTDEYLWATPQFGVTAVKRPGATAKGPRGR